MEWCRPRLKIQDQGFTSHQGPLPCSKHPCPGTHSNGNAPRNQQPNAHHLAPPLQHHTPPSPQGTPYYMAPEVLAHGMLSREADVFSFGVVLWELFHAQMPPWRDPEVLAAAAARLQMGGRGGGAGGAAARPRALPPTAVVAVLNESLTDVGGVGLGGGHGLAGPPPVGAVAARRASGMAPGMLPHARGAAGGVDTSGTTAAESFVLLPRPMLALDPSSPSGFSYPLPPDCPPGG